MKKFLLPLFAATCAANLLQAQLILDLAGTDRDPAFTLTVSNVENAVPTVVGGADTTATATGPMGVPGTGGVGTTGNLLTGVDAFNSFTVNGSNVISPSGTRDVTQANGGFGVRGNSGGTISGTDLLTMTFDFSQLNLPSNALVFVTGFTTSQNATDQTVRFLVDGVSDSIVSPNTGTRNYLSRVRVFDGTVIGFALPGGGDNYRLSTITIEAVPEPSTYMAIAGALGMIGLYVVRKRRSANKA